MAMLATMVSMADTMVSMADKNVPATTTQNQPISLMDDIEHHLPTMAMFLSLDEFWATSELKSGGAS